GVPGLLLVRAGSGVVGVGGNDGDGVGCALVGPTGRLLRVLRVSRILRVRRSGTGGGGVGSGLTGLRLVAGGRHRVFHVVISGAVGPGPGAVLASLRRALRDLALQRDGGEPDRVPALEVTVVGRFRLRRLRIRVLGLEPAANRKPGHGHRRPRRRRGHGRNRPPGRRSRRRPGRQRRRDVGTGGSGRTGGVGGGRGRGRRPRLRTPRSVL